MSPSRLSRATWPGAVLRYFRARRALIPFVGSVAYVVAVGVRVDAGASGRPWGLGLLAMVCAFVAATPSLPGNGLRDDGRRHVGLLAYALWGLALVLASLDATATDAWHEACGGAAAFGASVVGAQAVARIRGGQGIANSLPRPSPSLLVATVLMLATAFGLALTASLAAVVHPHDHASELLSHDANALASGAGLLTLGGTIAEMLRMKRLVLGAGDRALTALGGIVAIGLVTVGLLLLDEGAPDRILRSAVAVAAVLVTYVCTEGDAEALARRGRRAVALVLFGGPVVLLGALAAQGPGRSTTATLVTGLVALGMGSAIAYLELPLRRADGHLLDAVESARVALIHADPDSSVRDALAALRTFAGLSTQSPELWSLTPPRVLTVDGAGYTREREATLPERLLEIAVDEPEATVRAELLEVLVVRRPDLRPLARWMDERGALSATLVTREREPQGVLILPRGARTAPMSLEETRAIKRLADSFAGAAAASSALERSLERETVTRARAERAEASLQAREKIDRAASARDEIATARLAEPAMAGPYSPVARVAFEAMERRGVLGASIVLVAPNGADVVAYLARTHLAGPRRGAPFVVIDGASLSHHPLGRWRDPATSPLALAERGMLVLEDVARLPPVIQETLAHAITQKRAPWSEDETVDVILAVTLRSLPRPEDLAPALAALLEEALRELIVWPHLHERGEDLRSMVLAMLGREGVCLRGTPLGIEDGAYGQLANYPFPGEDAELRSIMQRLALLADGDGDLVRAAHVRALGLPDFGPVSASDAAQ